jgi:hypothetical protein
MQSVNNDTKGQESGKSRLYRNAQKGTLGGEQTPVASIIRPRLSILIPERILKEALMNSNVSEQLSEDFAKVVSRRWRKNTAQSSPLELSTVTLHACDQMTNLVCWQGIDIGNEILSCPNIG